MLVGKGETSKLRARWCGHTHSDTLRHGAGTRGARRWAMVLADAVGCRAVALADAARRQPIVLAHERQTAGPGVGTRSEVQGRDISTREAKRLAIPPAHGRHGARALAHRRYWPVTLAHTWEVLGYGSSTARCHAVALAHRR